ncbi:MAG: AAA family ATPase, partial [Actinomycetia bacterium]|nr:AAA family ATPase [Actinomycetes bacterium]
GHYDEWINGPRRIARDRYLGALAHLVQLNTGRADYQTALRHSLTLVDNEPLTEEWHRDVIRLYALNGQPSTAERQYEEFRRALSDELGIEPAIETVELIERIRLDASAPRPSFESSDEEEHRPFVGRSAERSTVLGRVNELISGKGGMVLVEADPGMGKTRLMEEVVRGAEWRGVQVLTGGHSQTSTLSPYEGLKAALEPATTGIRGERTATHMAPIWLQQASTVLPGLASVLASPVATQALRPDEEPWRMTEALVQVVLAQSKPKPTVLILEDVHWCDDDSMQLLVQLGDRLIDSGVLVCLTYQRDEAERSAVIWQALGELEAKPGSSRLVIAPLADDEIRQMVNSELGPRRMSEPALSQLIEMTGGNPYIILEVLQGPVDIFDPDYVSPGDARSGTADGGQLLPRLHDILTRRIESTDDDVNAVLEGLAIYGGPASTKILTTTLGMDRAEVVRALADAVDLGFLIEGTQGCEFAQEQTRVTVYGQIEPRLRARIHGRIVDALIGEPDIDTGQLAHHAWLAGQWDRAYDHHWRAGDAALNVNAIQTAAEHYAKADEAAQAAGLADRDRTGDLLAYEGVLEILGRRKVQQELLDRLSSLDGADPSTELEVTQRQAWLLANTDRGADAAELALSAVKKADAVGFNTGELLTIVGCARAWSGDLIGSIEPLEEAIDAFRRGGLSTVSAQLMLGRTHADLLNFEPARRYLDEVHDEAKADDDARSQVEALGHLATLHHSQLNELPAEAAFLEALELASDIGYRHGEGLNLVNLAAFYLMNGRAGRALGLLSRAADVFVSLGNGRGEAFVKFIGSEVAHHVCGDDDHASVQAEEAAIYFRRVGDERREANCLNTLASIDRRRRRRRLAKRRLASALAKATVSDDPRTVVQIHLNRALVELDLGHPDEALIETAVAAALDEDHVLDESKPALLAVQARAMSDLGEHHEAVLLVNRATPYNRPGADWAHLAAWWCAEALTAAGEETAAGEQVALAHQLLSRHLEGMPEPLAQMAWEVVPEHRAIAAAHEQYFVDIVEWRLPKLDAPTGRALETGEYQDVMLAVSHPEDRTWPTDSVRRQRRILRLASQAEEQGAAIRVSDLAELLKVSERTIKRDLSRLRNEGRNPPMRGRSEEKS